MFTPSKNVTRPFGVALETVAVRISGAPKVAGFAELASVTVAGCTLVNARVAVAPSAVAVTLATPEEFVTAVPEERTAEAPLEGAVKVTVTPAAGTPEDVSITWS